MPQTEPVAIVSPAPLFPLSTDGFTSCLLQETLPEETYFTRNGQTDMFWPWSINASDISGHCQRKYGLAPRFKWIAHSYGVGGAQGRLLGGSNIVFSNGASCFVYLGYRYLCHVAFPVVHNSERCAPLSINLLYGCTQAPTTPGHPAAWLT